MHRQKEARVLIVSCSHTFILITFVLNAYSEAGNNVSMYMVVILMTEMIDSNIGRPLKTSILQQQIMDELKVKGHSQWKRSTFSHSKYYFLD